MSVLHSDQWTNAWALKDSRMPMPKNNANLIQLAWNLAAFCIKVEPEIDRHDFQKINMTSKLARDIVKRTNRMKRKKKNGMPLALVFPFLLLIAARLTAVYNGATPEDLKTLDEGIGGLCMMTVVPALWLTSFRSRRRRRRMNRRFIRIFQKQIAAANARPSPPVGTAIPAQLVPA
ncbi:MAG: hypothetical protein HY053_03845 [Proteobacteria bacterium]|nr:hypothetical protein [Pseudomonadota bacterium]